jgi:hypothetical protein
MQIVKNQLILLPIGFSTKKRDRFEGISNEIG